MGDGTAVDGDPLRSPGDGLLGRIHDLDVAVYRAVARTSTPAWDVSIQRLSTAANYSRLSMTVAAVLATAGGPRGRWAAVNGLASVVTASAVANVAVKLLARRRRPERVNLGVILGRHIPMPVSPSFPSGHSAAAFAFAAGVGHEWPLVAVPLHVLAGAVAYSRVHTGVHFPGDVVVGSLIGLAASAAATRALDRWRASTGSLPSDADDG